jgi:hypothetical protein
MEAAGMLLLAQPVTFPDEGVHVHIYSVPGRLEVGVIFVAVLLQIALLRGFVVMTAEG